MEQAHGDVRRWAERALRIPAWDRDVWVSLLVALLPRLQGDERWAVARALWGLAAGYEAVRKLADREYDICRGACPRCRGAISPCRDPRVGWFCGRCGIIPREGTEVLWERATAQLAEKARGAAGCLFKSRGGVGGTPANQPAGQPERSGIEWGNLGIVVRLVTPFRIYFRETSERFSQEEV